MENAAIELSNNDFKVDVITFHETWTGSEIRGENFTVHRVKNPVGSHVNVLTWALTLGTEMQRVATDILAKDSEDAKMVHASEWLCVAPAIQLKLILGIPFTLSLYSTEAERSPGGPLNSSISYLEREGCAEAIWIFTRNEKTRDMIQKSYNVSSNRVLLFDSTSRPLAYALRRAAAELTIPGVNMSRRK